MTKGQTLCHAISEQAILDGMDRETAHSLNQVTSEFYAANAESFSSTRERPWDGWARVMEYVASVAERASDEHRPIRVLDIGCGNMRFEKMLAETFPERGFEIYAVDNCSELAQDFAQEANVRYQQLDVINCLETGALEAELDAPLCDLVVAFGFMHHIPMPQWREAILSTLIERSAPGGIIVIAFWQFANNKKMAAKATETTELGCKQLGVSLDPAAGDYLLGWQGSTDHLRYCHSFTDVEIEALEHFAATEGATPLASYTADGPDGKSNKYLLLKRWQRV